MKKNFSGYYSPSKDEFSKLWKDCVFIFDANVLLNLYRYTASTTDELIGILSKISDSIWVPNQAAFEYQKDRLTVISQQSEAYEKIQERLEETQRKLESELRAYSRHPLIDVDKIIRKINRHFSAIKKDLNKNKQSHPDLIHSDHLRDTITTLLDGKVGSPYREEQLKEIYEKGDKRYKQSIPPGFSDTRKEGIEKYGDLVLWFQIIDRAKEIKKPIIFVTDDRKEDWWYKFKGETIGPHPKLVEEIKSEAGVLFYMYHTERFMKHAQDYLKQKVEQKAIEEVREVQRSLGERNAVLSDWVNRVATSRVRVLSDLDKIRDSLARISKSDVDGMLANVVTSRALDDLDRIRDSLTAQLDEFTKQRETDKSASAPKKESEE